MKRTKKFLSMLLALVMVIGLLPTVALAANTEITSVAISVTEPVGTVKPKYDVKLPAGANYEVLTAYELENGIVDGTFWHTTSGGSSGSGVLLTSDTAFTADTEYGLTVYLVAKEGYEFASTATGTVNSNAGIILHNIDDTVEALAPDRDIITISYTFTAVDPTTHVITAGGGSEFNKQGSADELSITADADFDKFRGVEVDGDEIAESNYTAESGSTIVKLKKSYLSTLAEGDHTLEMLFSDGSASTKFTITDKELAVETITIPVLKSISFNAGNVRPGAKDFTVSMELQDSEGKEVEGMVIVDNTISTDGTKNSMAYYEDSISFTVPEDVYANITGYTLVVEENDISEKGWDIDDNTITVSFVKGNDGLTFDCNGVVGGDFDGSVIPNIVLENTFALYEIEIPVEKTVVVRGEGTAPKQDFEFDVYLLKNPKVDPNNGIPTLSGTIGTALAAVDIATDGADTYNTTIEVTLDGTEFIAGTGASLVVVEKNEGVEGWAYSTGDAPAWVIDIAPAPQVNSLDLFAEGDDPVEEPFSLDGYVISYYPVYLISDNNEVTALASAVKENVAAFENTYTVPVPVVVTIPFTKTVKAIGNGTVPAETFEFDVEFPYNSQLKLDKGDIVASIETNGAGTYDGEITITMTDREFDSACTQNGRFAVLISEKNEGAYGWAYFPFDYWVEFSGWVIASEEESDAPQASISKYPNATAACYMMSGIGDNAAPDRDLPFDMPVFENNYTVPTNVIIEIPFTKTVELGGNRAPGSTSFEFELLTPFYEGDLDMEVEGTTVATNGKGTYNGKIVIAVAEEDLGALSEGMVLVEKNAGADNWTYDDTAWFISLYPIVVNDLEEDRPSAPLSGYSLAYNVADKIEGDNGLTYRPSNESAETISFTNTYTKNVSTGGGSGSSTTSKPVLNKEDHTAFLQGYADGTFGPNRNMTRAEVTVMFARLLVEKMEVGKTYANSFSDVPADYWAANEIGYMEKFGIINGFSDGTFRPTAPVTRAQFAAIVCRFEELTEGKNAFVDVPEDYWAADYISFATERGWVNGFSDGTFRPNANITRAQVAAVTCRLLERVADEKYVEKNYDDLNRTFTDVQEGHWAFWYAIEAANGHEYTKSKGSETWTKLLEG